MAATQYASTFVKEAGLRFALRHEHNMCPRVFLGGRLVSAMDLLSLCSVTGGTGG